MLTSKESRQGAARKTLLCEATLTTPGLRVVERRACNTLQNVSC